MFFKTEYLRMKINNDDKIKKIDGWKFDKDAINITKK